MRMSLNCLIWLVNKALTMLEKFHSTIEKGHRRLEIRRYAVMENTEYLLGAEKWTRLRSIGMVESERRLNGQISSVEQRYYILSLNSDAPAFC